MTKRLFHLLTDEAFKALQDSDATWGDIGKKYRQPVWCDYPDALHGIAGCLSLIYRRGVGRSFCSKCDLFSSSPFAQERQNIQP